MERLNTAATPERNVVTMLMQEGKPRSLIAVVLHIAVSENWVGSNVSLE